MRRCQPQCTGTRGTDRRRRYDGRRRRTRTGSARDRSTLLLRHFRPRQPRSDAHRPPPPPAATRRQRRRCGRGRAGPPARCVGRHWARPRGRLPISDGRAVLRTNARERLHDLALDAAASGRVVRGAGPTVGGSAVQLLCEMSDALAKVGRTESADADLLAQVDMPRDGGSANVEPAA